MALAVLLGGTALGWGAWAYARLAADEAYDRLLLGSALQMAEAITVHEDGQVAVDPPLSAFAALSLAPRDRVFYQVRAPSGALLTGDADLSPPASPGRVRLVAGPVFADADHLGSRVRLVGIGRHLGDAVPSGAATVWIAQTREARTQLARELMARAAVLLAVMGLLGLAGAYAAVRLALAPLSRIEAELVRRDSHDLRVLDARVPREVEALVGSINGFMARLARRVGTMNRFIADATHQIRTPLAALTSQVDLLGRETDEARRATQVERIRKRVSELARLSNQVLSHALVIHRTDAVALEPIDLVPIARQALADAVPLSLDRDLDIGWTAPDGAVIVRGDAVSLGEAIANLIGNALKYGAYRRLEIAVGSAQGAAWIEVADDGPGIPAAEWPGVRKAFQRGAAASKDTVGAGLGLAIVEDVMRAHDGRLEFGRRAADGADLFLARLVFPAAGARPATSEAAAP